jgi:hypothetical protein
VASAFEKSFLLRKVWKVIRDGMCRLELFKKFPLQQCYVKESDLLHGVSYLNMFVSCKANNK